MVIWVDETTRSNALLPVSWSAETARIVKRLVPLVVGVPLNWPVTAFSVMPCGRVPAETDQLNGAVPPVAVRLAAYTDPTRAAGTAEGEIVKAGAETLKV